MANKAEQRREEINKKYDGLQQSVQENQVKLKDYAYGVCAGSLLTMAAITTYSQFENIVTPEVVFYSTLACSAGDFLFYYILGRGFSKCKSKVESQRQTELSQLEESVRVKIK
ncbi:MAG: hypothetical protein Q8N88_06975 [Nanoarchaeota archaeon]|nr:hypothetical protein [Nanoarchaeota archaeon]